MEGLFEGNREWKSDCCQRAENSSRSREGQAQAMRQRAQDSEEDKAGPRLVGEGLGHGGLVGEVFHSETENSFLVFLVFAFAADT